ncbi:MAG: adenine phosphoribosyltransferase [Deltaproteobacteria bacterium]|nr:adenine phosphoribosyltransferase [Deltaproteobacteria bacterium]
MSLSQDLDTVIRNVPDFPKPGIQFKDITPLFAHPNLIERVIEDFVNQYKDGVDVIVGVESRGFLFGVPLALKLGIPFVLARKAGKLPADKISHTYDLEYGTATLEMHSDSIQAGQRVVIIDDLLATGGTARATASLVQELGGTVASFAFVIALDFLKGAETLPAPSYSILHY